MTPPRVLGIFESLYSFAEQRIPSAPWGALPVKLLSLTPTLGVKTFLAICNLSMLIRTPGTTLEKFSVSTAFNANFLL